MTVTGLEPAKTSKGEQTRAAILETALALFRERGYEETTMRAIAERAEVSLGNAYYYFRSKEHLIQAFYNRLQDAHLAATADILETEPDLKARLSGVMRAMIRMTEPYHRFAGVLFRTAADPESPLNPFGPESEPARRQSIALFTRVVEGSSIRIPADLKHELPYLLWLYHMGITLFWIHDSSPGTRRTYRLIDRTVDIVVKLIGLASNPLMRPLRKAALSLVTELRDGAERS
jgi:AcrR family transcriptional regulator